jgi:hypothetical protein
MISRRTNCDKHHNKVVGLFGAGKLQNVTVVTDGAAGSGALCLQELEYQSCANRSTANAGISWKERQ